MNSSKEEELEKEALGKEAHQTMQMEAELQENGGQSGHQEEEKVVEEEAACTWQELIKKV